MAGSRHIAQNCHSVINHKGNDAVIVSFPFLRKMKGVYIMTLGHAFYFKEYKNLTITQLKRRLRNLQTPQHLLFLRRLREEEINSKIDDTNTWSDHHTSIEVLNLLIEYKTLYPKSDLSNWDDYWAVKNAIEQNTGAIETQKLVVPRNSEKNTDECVVNEGELPIIPTLPPAPPICPDEIINK